MRSHRTDTVLIHVIDVEPVCGWCKVRLRAIPDVPVVYRGTDYHPWCAGAQEKMDAFAHRVGRLAEPSA